MTRVLATYLFLSAQHLPDTWAQCCPLTSFSLQWHCSRATSVHRSDATRRQVSFGLAAQVPRTTGGSCFHIFMYSCMPYLRAHRVPSRNDQVIRYPVASAPFVIRLSVLPREQG